MHKPRKIKLSSYVDNLCVREKMKAYAEVAEDTDDIMAVWLKVEDYFYAEHIGQAGGAFTYGDHFPVTNYTEDQIDQLANFMLALIIEGVAGGRRAQMMEIRGAWNDFAKTIEQGVKEY